MRLLLIPALTLPLMAGSCLSPPPPVEVSEAYFCDVEEARRFSREEWAWREKNAPWNLAKDIKTNLTWERECIDLTDGI